MPLSCAGLVPGLRLCRLQLSLACACDCLHAADAAYGAQELRREVVQLVRVEGGELPEHLFAMRGDAEQNPAPVSGVFGAEEQALGDGAIDELDGAVVPEAEPLGRVGDRRFLTFRDAGYLEQQLMLLRLQAGVVRGFLAEMQKDSELVAEGGECAQEGAIARCIVRACGHPRIVLRHIDWPTKQGRHRVV